MSLKECWTFCKLECAILAGQIHSVLLALTHTLASYLAPSYGRNAWEEIMRLRPRNLEDLRFYCVFTYMITEIQLK